jgi:methionyl aminopeptidase
MIAGSGRALRIPRKSSEELQHMAAAGAITAQALAAVVQAVGPGVSSLELDQIAEAVIREAGATPSFKGYRGYPGTLCVEINDVVVHGIPRADEVMHEGDIVGLDIGACCEGFHGDAATTVAVGAVSEVARRLLEATETALAIGVQRAQPGGVLGDISQGIAQHVEAQGFSCVTDLVGHGIGRQMHEAPQVPNFYDPRHFRDYETRLRPGMVLAIEPMVNAGGAALRLDPDQWTMRTADGQLSAHFEHTVAITKEGPVILTTIQRARFA